MLIRHALGSIPVLVLCWALRNAIPLSKIRGVSHCVHDHRSVNAGGDDGDYVLRATAKKNVIYLVTSLVHSNTSSPLPLGGFNLRDSARGTLLTRFSSLLLLDIHHDVGSSSGGVHPCLAFGSVLVSSQKTSWLSVVGVATTIKHSHATFDIP